MDYKTPRSSRRFSFALLALCTVSLASCRSGASNSPTATPGSVPSPSPTAPPTSLPISSQTPLGASRSLAGGLVLEEHRLLSAPQTEPLTFVPEEGTQEDVLGAHASQRQRDLSSRVLSVDGNPALSAPWNGGSLLAILLTAQGETPQQTVQLLQEGEVIFSAPAGLPSPALPLQGLWTYDGHWALELLLATPDVWEGQIFIDGDLLNDLDGYEEAFAFQLIGARPFFLYQREGRIGLSYDAQEVDLGFDQVTHYQCCSGTVLNPIHAQEMIAFFAQRNGLWYYVEIGLFD